MRTGIGCWAMEGLKSRVARRVGQRRRNMRCKNMYLLGMKKYLPLLAGILSFLMGLKAMGQAHSLWYTRPAGVWTEALPVGNGRLGAMVFGGVGEERIALNEATLWSGGPGKASVNPGASQHLPALRKALFA